MADRLLILVDPNKELVEFFKEYFVELPNVEIVNGIFESLPTFDCVVCPASSFGMVDHGVDAAITRYFGDGLKTRIKQRILDDYLGEQPVGTAFIEETGDSAHPFLAHTPTMREAADVVSADNTYHAMWATLLAIRKHNGQNPTHSINVIACPGLGMETAHLPFKDVARQMAMAYRNFLDPLRYMNFGIKDPRESRIWSGKSLNRPTGELDPKAVEKKDDEAK